MSSPYHTGRFAHVSAGDLEGVTSGADVARIVDRMRADLLAHPDEWENPTLDRFLNSLAAVVASLPNAGANRSESLPTQPTWRDLADILVAASGYE